MKKWLSAFRLKTLPLAFASILMGASVAYTPNFNWLILVLALSSATFLQVLSNLANDYGDAISGVDDENRLGPKRAIQSGSVSISEMKVAVFVFVFLSLISGISLLFVSFQSISTEFIVLFAIGTAAIIAAIKYTVGNNAYGYSGFGDIAVFIFFGLVGVLGSDFLISKSLDFSTLFPATTVGLLSIGVLNLNNLRDIENDKKYGKNTVVVKFGKKWATTYHSVLLIGAFLSFLIYLITIDTSYLRFLSLIVVVPVLISNLIAVRKHKNPKELIPRLKQLALGTFLLSMSHFILTILES